MSDFSTVSIDDGCPFFPRHAWGEWFQSKDFPEHESDTACIDGAIRSDGLFVRTDELWNPALNGWVEMRSTLCSPEMFFSVRFSAGKMVEIKEGRMPFEFDGPMAWESPNDWQSVPETIG